MNKRLLNPILLFALLLLSGTAYSQAVSMTAATTGLAGAAQVSGTNDIAILGVQLTKAAGGGNTVTSITVGMTPTPVGKFTTARLFKSTDANFDGVGSEMQIATGTITATDISFTGSPLTNFDGATALADDEYLFIVVNVDPTATTGSTTTPSLLSTAVIVSTGTTSGSTINGATYTLTAPQITIANVTNSLAPTPLIAGSTNQPVFGFSLQSTGTQNVSAITVNVTSTAVGKWGSYTLWQSDDNDFATAGNNTNAGGSFDASSGTTIVITGLSQSITSTTKYYFLTVNVDNGVNGGTATILPSLANTGITSTPATGTYTGSAAGPAAAYAFAPRLTIANLTAGLAPTTLVAGTTGQAVFGFSLTSSSSQTVTTLNVQLTNTPTPTDKWTNYKIYRSTDPDYSTLGNNTEITTAVITPSSNQIQIGSLTEAITTAGTNYFLVVDINPAVTGATSTIQPSLAPANVTITTGGGIASSTATGATYNFSGATATFAHVTGGIAASPLVAGATNQAVLGFSAVSNTSQTFTGIAIQLTSTPVSKWGNYKLYRSTDNTYATAGNNTEITTATITPSAGQIAITTLSESLTTTPLYYFLVVDVNTTVTETTTAVQPNFTETHITAGNVNAVTVTGTNYQFSTSRASDITFTGGSSSTLNYRTIQATSINNTVLSGSFRLGTFQLRDGGGSSDADDKASSITSITLQITNPDNIRQIALFNASNSHASDDEEIDGTEQAMPGSGTVTFNPTNPIRTLTDGGNWNFMVRVTFKSTVTDNQAMVITVTSVTGENGYSGFTNASAGGATSASGSNHTILVTGTEFRYIPAVTTTAPVGQNFGPVVIRAVDLLGNRDLDYNGKVDLIASGGPGSLTGGGQKTLSSGQISVPTVSINQAGNYSLVVSDNDYNDPPDNQPFMDNVSTPIAITSEASGITPSVDPQLCYGNTASAELLTPIIITETDEAGISGSGSVTFSIALPPGFVFDQSVTSGVTLGGPGSDLASASTYTYPGPNVVQFSFTVNGTSNLNTITISNLRARYPHPGIESPGATGTLNITRLGGTATIAGVGAGTILGSISAQQRAVLPTVSFTVKELPGNPEVDEDATTFNAGTVPVKLEPAVGITPSETVFQGPNGGVFLAVAPEYRFDPGSLSPGQYPVTMIHTIPATGCQAYVTKNFEVIISGIVGLAATYCSNDETLTTMSVNQLYIDELMQYMPYPTTWRIDKFVYYDYTFGWRDISTPSNDVFDPKLNEYQDDYAYWGGQIPVGFSVYNTNPLAGYPQGSNFVWTYQWVNVRPAPTVSFSLPSDIYSYCQDNAAVTLTGNPANGPTVANDEFSTTDPNGLGAITSALSAGVRTWSFVPSLVTGVNSSTSQTIDITYKYTDPATNCSNTTERPVTVHFRPTAVPNTDINRSQPGSIPTDETIIQLCQGSTAPFSYSVTDLTYNYRWYEGTVSPANLKSQTTTFSPSVSRTTPGNTNYIVTRERNGCESVTSNLSLQVRVIALPTAPVPNFPDANRQYCVNGTVTPTHLGVPGTDLKWYNGSGTLIGGIADDNLPTVGELNIATNNPADYSFSVSQTEGVNFCEGPKTVLTVTVKALPNVSITAVPGINPARICTTTDQVVRFVARDLANPAAPAPNGTWTLSSSAGTPNIFPLDGAIELNPLAATPGTYALQYNYTNPGSCSNTGSIDLTILPKLTPSITISDACKDAPSEITINPSTGTVLKASWNFFDGSPIAADTVTESINTPQTTGTYGNPHHVFPNIGTFQVTGVLTTPEGCDYTIPQTSADVHPMPVANFTSHGVCVDTPREFRVTSDILIETYNWTFATEGNLGDASDNTDTSNPIIQHTYNLTGTDIARLVATTEFGCSDIVEKRIYSVHNLATISATSTYTENFADSTGGWIAGGRNSSWQWDTPASAPTSTNEEGWNTTMDQNNESSWVLSGCFNFPADGKPVLSLDIWSDGSIGVDGAVIQYNTSGNIEDDILGENDTDGSWERLGVVNSGINWYDAQGISNNPGNQTTVSAGWTGKYPEWKTAIYKLDELNGLNNVVFRIAFATNAPKKDANGDPYTGFAFDNIFMGQRNRIVLQENFTNSSGLPNSSGQPSTHSLTNYENFPSVATQEIVKVQYHTGFPGADAINALNPSMNNSRAAFYGITLSPNMRLDGSFGIGSIASWLTDSYDDRVLTPAELKLNVTAVNVDGVVRINTSVENTTNQTFPAVAERLHIFTVVVDTLVEESTLLGNSGKPRFINVAKEMLPSAAGVPITTNIQPGPTNAYVAEEIIWNKPNGTKVVVFVQKINDERKEVYQAAIVKPVGGPPDIVTGTEDPEYAEHIYLYPNPANHEVNIQLPAAVNKPTPVMMVDAFGRIVYQSVFQAGERTKTVSTSTFADGIYMLQLAAPQGSKVVKKVMVTHR